MANNAEAAREAVFNRIVELAPVAPTAEKVLALAEAFAYAYQPNNSHGGGASK